MRTRRVHLRLPELPSDDVLLLAQAIKDAVAPAFNIRLILAEEDQDDFTPVDSRPNEKTLVLRIEEMG